MNVLLVAPGAWGELQERGPGDVGERKEQLDGQIIHGRWGSPGLQCSGISHQRAEEIKGLCGKRGLLSSGSPGGDPATIECHCGPAASETAGRRSYRHHNGDRCARDVVVLGERVKCDNGHDLFRSHAPLHHTNEPVSVRLILRRAAGPVS
jgi:hypothetical protein